MRENALGSWECTEMESHELSPEVCQCVEDFELKSSFIGGQDSS